MRSSSYKRSLSTRAPVTSVIDQSLSAMQQSGHQSTQINRLEQSAGWTSPPTLQGRSHIHQRFDGSVQQTLLLKNVKPRTFQLEFSPISEQPGGSVAPQTPVLFTVDGTKSRLSSATYRPKPQGIKHPPRDNGAITGISDTNEMRGGVTKLVVSSGHRSRPSSSGSNSYPLHWNHGNAGSYTPNLTSTPYAINEEHRKLDFSPQQVLSDMISPIQHRMGGPAQLREELKSTAVLTSELSGDEQYPQFRNFRVQASNKAMAFVATQERTLHEPPAGRSSHRAKRSTSASRPQYSKPNHPAFIKEVDVALHKLQSNAIYSSTIDMLSNNNLTHVYAVQPTHFKMMRKKWKASDPPSLPPPPSSDDVLPDGIPVLTANPRELRDQYLGAMKPVQPIPSSSIGFFVESDPHVPKKKYTLRRVSSADASSAAAQRRSSGRATVQELWQHNPRLTRSSCADAPSLSDRTQFPGDALLTPDVSMQTDAADAPTTPVRDVKDDRLTIDELQQPLLIQKQLHESVTSHGQGAHATKLDRIPPRSRSAGEYSASQEEHYYSTDKTLLNVRSLIDNRHRLRPPPSSSSRSSSSRRAYSAQPSNTKDALSLSRLQSASRTASNTTMQRRPAIRQGAPFSGRQLGGTGSSSVGQDVASVSHGIASQNTNNNTTRRHPLSTSDLSHSSSAYKTVYGEKPIARGFTTRSTRLMHNSLQSVTNSTSSSLRPDVSLTPYQSVPASRALAISAVLPTSSLALSMASSYMQSQARSKYNMALMRLQAPDVALETTPSQRSTARTASASASARHSRRTVGIQPHSSTDQSTNTLPPVSSTNNIRFSDTNSTKPKGPNYFTRTRNAKIGTTELKDACTETGSYKSTSEISDARSSVDCPSSSGQNRSVQALDETRTHRSRSSSFREVARKSRPTHLRSQSSSSARAADRSSTVKHSSAKRSHSATFHTHDDRATLAPAYSISTTDMLAARRLIQPKANIHFTDHKRDVITRHLADIATIPLHLREARLSTEKSNRLGSPSLAEMLQGLDIPTINSAESSALYDPRTIPDDQSASASAYDPSISRNQSADGTFSSMRSLPSAELSGRNLNVYPQSSEFVQLLGTTAFPSSSATLDMYIGGLNYQEIDLQHHIFSKHSTATLVEPIKESGEASKKKPVRRTRSSSVSASSSGAHNTKRCRSSSSSYSNPRQGQAVSNSATQMTAHDVEPQVSLDPHSTAQTQSSINADMVLEDLDTDGIDASYVTNSAVRTSNYKETVLLKRKAPDGRTRLAMVSTGDILYDSSGVKTTLTLSAQQSKRSLSSSAHTALRQRHNKAHPAKKVLTMFNYPSITGTFPLYPEENEQETEPHAEENIANKDSPPRDDRRRVSRSLPPNKQLRRPENATSSLARHNHLSGGPKPLSISVSAAMARRAFERQANDGNLNALMHQTAVSDVSGLHGSPTASFPRDLSHISQRQSLDKETIVAQEQDRDTVYQSPIIFTSLANTSPPLPPNPGSTAGDAAGPDDQNTFISSQLLLKSHTVVDDPRKESAYRARSNRLTESEKGIQMSALSDTQRSFKMEQSHYRTDGRGNSQVRQYSRSHVRPMSSSSLSGSMTAGRASRSRARTPKG